MAIPIGAIMQLAGGLMSGYSDYQEGKETAANLEYDAYIATQDAELIEKSGEHELHKARMGRRKLLARQIAVAAASGRDISGGSPLAVMEAAERAALLDEKIISYNTNIAVGAKKSEAAMLFGTSRAVKSAAKMGMFTSLLGVGAKFSKAIPRTTKPGSSKTKPAKTSTPPGGNKAPISGPQNVGGGLIAAKS